MQQILLTLLTMQPTCLCAIQSVHRIRPVKHPVIYCTLTLATMDFIWLLNQYILPKPNALLNYVTLFAAYFYLPFFAQEGHRLHAMLAHAIVMTLTLIAVTITEHVTMAIAALQGFNPRKLIDINDPMYLVMVLINASIVIPLQLLLTSYMKKQIVPTAGTSKIVWFLSIPLSQTALLIMVNRYMQFDNTLRVWAFLLTGALLCIGADFLCIFSYRRYHQLQYMTNLVNQASQQLKTQNEYYHEMQDSILRVNQIRHDLNNQLKTAYYLLEQGHPEEVRAQLDSLQACIQNRIGTKYCENLMVDAVLREKAARCRQLEIPLELHVLVPADLNIESAHLCSAFSNLLDNCIAAAQKAGPGSGPIRLRSDVHKGYLTISCSNPSVPPRQETRQDILRRHGLGLEILGRLSKLHSGSFETDFRDGRFYVSLILKNL